MIRTLARIPVADQCELNVGMIQGICFYNRITLQWNLGRTRGSRSYGIITHKRIDEKQESLYGCRATDAV